MIYFCTLCERFERRLAWQLQSIAEQEDCPRLLIEIAMLMGNARARDLCYHFRNYHGMDCIAQNYQRDTFAYRGYVRNRQIQIAKAAGADYIFFADCDNVYHPAFFRLLLEQLDGMSETKCVAAKGKIHTERDATDEACLDFDAAPFPDDAYRIAAELPRMKKGNRPIAGGGMQVCRMSELLEKTGGIYVEQTKDSHLFTKGQRAKSDIQFRKVMSGSTMIDLPPEIHLQHYRDKEEGHHLEDQR